MNVLDINADSGNLHNTFVIALTDVLKLEELGSNSENANQKTWAVSRFITCVQLKLKLNHVTHID